MTKAQANQASIRAFVISTVRREMKAIGIYRRNEVGMITRNIIRQSLKTLAPALFLLLCCSISAFAQSPSEPQESGKKDLIKATFSHAPVKSAIFSLGRQMGLNIVFDDAVKNDTLTIELNDVTIEQALKTILEEKKLQARIIEEKTIIIAPDNETCRYYYKQYELWPAKSDANK